MSHQPIHWTKTYTFPRNSFIFIIHSIDTRLLTVLEAMCIHIAHTSEDVYTRRKCAHWLDSIPESGSGLRSCSHSPPLSTEGFDLLYIFMSFHEINYTFENMCMSFYVIWICIWAWASKSKIKLRICMSIYVIWTCIWASASKPKIKLSPPPYPHR